MSQLETEHPNKMTRNLKSYLNIFYFTGISLKSFERNKSFHENLVSIWSHGMTMVFMVMLGATVYTKPSYAENTRVKIFLNFAFYYFCFCIFTEITLTIMKKKAEENFWNLVSETEEIFKYQLRVKMNNKKFNVRCWLNIVLPTLITSTAIIVNLISTAIQRISAVDIVLFGPILFSRLFINKFLLYVSLLQFCLNEIKLKLMDQSLSLDEMRCLKKAYTLCWKMSSIIEEIFGYGLLVQAFSIFFVTLVTGHSLCVGETSWNVAQEVIINAFVMNIYTMLILSISCQECIDCSSSIAPLLFTKSSKTCRTFIESFALQILLQRITFKPLKVFAIDKKNMSSVSFNHMNYLIYFCHSFNSRQSQQFFFTT